VRCRIAIRWVPRMDLYRSPEMIPTPIIVFSRGGFVDLSMVPVALPVTPLVVPNISADSRSWNAALLSDAGTRRLRRHAGRDSCASFLAYAEEWRSSNGGRPSVNKQTQEIDPVMERVKGFTYRACPMFASILRSYRSRSISVGCCDDSGQYQIRVVVSACRTI
jgi:hypothetical protein